MSLILVYADDEESFKSISPRDAFLVLPSLKKAPSEDGQGFIYLFFLNRSVQFVLFY